MGTLLIAGFASSLARQNYADQRTAAALSQAKAALIGYAATYPDHDATGVFGFLPCPDMGSASVIPEGNMDVPCGSRDVTVIGRLPWKELGLQPLRDGFGDCLWYAVSGNFKENLTTPNSRTLLLNWDSNGLIEVVGADGTSLLAGSAPTNRAAAVIFAPGRIFASQD
ncbi:MAG: hypothetical protein ABI728_13530, partial [Betaproteobacteria bacterium]